MRSYPLVGLLEIKLRAIGDLPFVYFWSID
jgi:hypothetical protein